MIVLETVNLKKYYGVEPNITKALDGINPLRRCGADRAQPPRGGARRRKLPARRCVRSGCR